MEEILRKLQKDASGHKHKGIRDACVYACGECTTADPPFPPWLSGCREGGPGGDEGGRDVLSVCSPARL